MRFLLLLISFLKSGDNPNTDVINNDYLDKKEFKTVESNSNETDNEPLKNEIMCKKESEPHKRLPSRKGKRKNIKTESFKNESSQKDFKKPRIEKSELSSLIYTLNTYENNPNSDKTKEMHEKDETELLNSLQHIKDLKLCITADEIIENFNLHIDTYNICIDDRKRSYLDILNYMRGIIFKVKELDPNIPLHLQQHKLFGKTKTKSSINPTNEVIQTELPILHEDETSLIEIQTEPTSAESKLEHFLVCLLLDCAAQERSLIRKNKETKKKRNQKNNNLNKNTKSKKAPMKHKKKYHK